MLSSTTWVEVAATSSWLDGTLTHNPSTDNTTSSWPTTTIDTTTDIDDSVHLHLSPARLPHHPSSQDMLVASPILYVSSLLSSLICTLLNLLGQHVNFQGHSSTTIRKQWITMQNNNSWSKWRPQFYPVRVGKTRSMSTSEELYGDWKAGSTDAFLENPMQW